MNLVTKRKKSENVLNIEVFKCQGIQQSSKLKAKCINCIQLTGNVDENTRQKCFIWLCTAHVKTAVAQSKYSMFEHILMELHPAMNGILHLIQYQNAGTWHRHRSSSVPCDKCKMKSLSITTS